MDINLPNAWIIDEFGERAHKNPFAQIPWETCTVGGFFDLECVPDPEVRQTFKIQGARFLGYYRLKGWKFKFIETEPGFRVIRIR